MTRARELEFKLFSRVWIYSNLPDDGSWGHRGNAKHSRKEKGGRNTLTSPSFLPASQHFLSLANPEGSLQGSQRNAFSWAKDREYPETRGTNE